METNETKIVKLRALTADIEQRHAAIHNRLGVSEAEFAVAKAARAKAAVPVSAPRSGQFNPQLFASPEVHAKFLPHDDAAFDDDDGIPSADDDSTAAHIKRAQNHLEMCDEDMCRAAPTDGPDHMSLAAKHIQEAMEQRARAGRLAAVGQNVVSVRFA
jgi:hypothetical protein